METQDARVAKDERLTVLQPAEKEQLAAGMTLAAARADLGIGLGAELRADSAQSQGWQGLDNAAAEPGFDERVEREFPTQAQEWVDPVSRRGFMKLMGASLAMAGLAGCTKQPDEPIYPYIQQPEDLILGKPNYFATTMPFATGSLPLLVKSDAYRPIKIDGNPEHPMSRGKSDVFSQGSLLGLYDPDRSQHVLYHLETSTFANFQAAVLHDLPSMAGGQGLYILSSTITSPTLAAQWKDVQKRLPQAKLIQYDPVNRDSARRASKAAFGDFYDAQYMLEKADVILSLDADFLSGIAHPGFLTLARDYANRRKLMDASVEMNRLYAVESMPTTTGMKADHRLKVKASHVAVCAQAVAMAVGAGGSQLNLTAEQQAFIAALAADLKANAGKCVVIPGEQQSAEVHQAAIAMNQALGNVGKTVVYTETVQPLPSIQGDDLKALVADMNAGKVQWLFILDSNPVYTAPVDLKFAEALTRVPKSAQLGSHKDETSQIATWHINAAHYLEAWSDARAYDGTLSVVQPMIDPLYGGKTAHVVMQALLDDPQRTAFAAVQETWRQQLAGKGDFDAAWRKVLHDGFLAGSAFAPKSVSAVAMARVNINPPASVPDNAIEVIFRADPTIYDGRYSNIGWLQELPKPVVNNSWDNAVIMSGPTKVKLGLDENDVVEITLNGNTVRGPVVSVPGHPDNSLTVHLGYGRERAGRVGSGMGFNAYRLRTSDAPLFATGATIKKTGDVWGIAVTKSHYSDDRGKRALAGQASLAMQGDVAAHSLEGDEAITRGIVRSATLEEFKKEPNFAHEGDWPEDPERNTTMFDNWEYPKNAWGLAIDQNSCVGCNACVVSCYAENNIAVVGKHNVKTGRDMQWLRIDTYFEGDLQSPRAHFQPMMCQHCENAPCEQVCPVAATVHTPEGLNTMVYNRCVGTRYCSNNCPYKVRRFNFLLFSDYETESLKFMRNPDVTVRSRGVMEKCTYCVQRIAVAKIEADKENRAIRDGEIVTACQQACPTDAIVFGNINDKNSRVSKIKAQQRNYSVLADLNTRPRTTYIAEVINPNQALVPAQTEHAPEHG